MKGIKTMSLANGTSKLFHAEELFSKTVKVKESLTIGDVDILETVKKLTKENTDLKTALDALEKKFVALDTKVNSFETEE